MAKPKATAEQLEAMKPCSNALLVSAGAGSGKTWVLTQRILRAIAPEDRNEKPADITDFLVITYTRAAAAQLKARISEGLSELTALESSSPEPDRKRLAHLRKQTALIGRAQISTIHSFCADLLREFGMTAGIRPDFRIIEEERAEQMKHAALDRVLEEHYAEPEKFPGFQALTETLGRGRDDRKLVQLVTDLDTRLQSQAYPARWVERQKALLRRDWQDLSDSPWGKEVLSHMLPKIRIWTGKMRSALREIEEEAGPVCANYRDSFAGTLERMEALSRAADTDNNGNWEEIRKALPVPYPRLGAKKVEDTAFRDRMKAIREGCRNFTDRLPDVFSAEPEKVLADIRETAPALEALMDLTLDFEAEYGREKRRKALMDFTDLEHAAAQMLTGGNGPSALAGSVSGRYREILVDEYQDVSPVQEIIFEAISRKGENLVMVGDIKQSIYRFRLAEPAIFNRKYDAFRHYREAKEGEARRIPMKANFRSRREIIAAVNSIFRTCMSRELGDVDYLQPDHQLDAEASYNGEGEKPQLVLFGFPSAAERKETGSGRKDREAAWVAGEISRLMRSGMTVKDGEEERPLRWSDVAILLRSFKTNEAVFRRELERAGIPVVSATGTDLYAEPETAFLMNMLSIVDNPHKDVPLLALLRSPAFGFTADELAEIRMSDRENDLFSALSAAAGKNEKYAGFIRMLESYRSSVPDIQVSELLWRIICEQDLVAVSSAMGEGEQRRDRILNFIELCSRFEESDSRGLHSFLEWLELMNDREQIPSIVSGHANGVSLLTVHRSKGLEYPVVFVSGTGSEFNRKDYSGSVLVDPEIGLGSRKVDRRRKIEYPTLARTAIEEKIRRETLSEEMRLQYVALTRAKERLYITGSAASPETLLEKAALSIGEGDPDPEYLSGAASALQWYAAAAVMDRERTFHIRIVPPETEDKQETVSVEERETPAGEEILRLEQKLRENLAAVYPYGEAAALPSKITATELKGLRSEPEEDEEAVRMTAFAEQKAYSFPLPVFGKKDRVLSAAERGTATHTLLQHLNWSLIPEESEIRREIERVKAEGFLSTEEAAAIDIRTVQHLAASSLGRRTAAAFQRGSLQREFRFSLLVDAGRLLDTAAREQILLQGVVDCFFEEEDGIVLVDYKTDRVYDEDAIRERAEHYRDQLEAYADALVRITGKPVKERILVFLEPGREIRLENRG